MTEQEAMLYVRTTAHLPLLIDLKTVAREAGCSESTVHRAVKANQLNTIKRAGRRYVPKHEFLKWAYATEAA